MALTAPTRRASAASRRFGYLVAVAVNAALLYAVHSWPGWQSLSFLTADTLQVLGWIDASLLAGIAANVTYLVLDARWWKALGDLVTTAIGLGAMVKVWQVFPFSFADADVDWALVVRVALVIGMVGAAIGLLAQVVTLARPAARSV